MLALLYSHIKNYTPGDAMKWLEAQRWFWLKIESQEKIANSGPLTVVINYPPIFIDRFWVSCMMKIYRLIIRQKSRQAIYQNDLVIYPYSEKSWKTPEKSLFRKT